MKITNELFFEGLTTESAQALDHLCTSFMKGKPLWDDPLWVMWQEKANVKDHERLVHGALVFVQKALASLVRFWAPRKPDWVSNIKVTESERYRVTGIQLARMSVDIVTIHVHVDVEHIFEPLVTSVSGNKVRIWERENWKHRYTELEIALPEGWETRAQWVPGITDLGYVEVTFLLNPDFTPLPLTFHVDKP